MHIGNRTGGPGDAPDDGAARLEEFGYTRLAADANGAATNGDGHQNQQQKQLAPLTAKDRELLLVFGPAFARRWSFWAGALRALVQGALMGLVALGFYCAFEGFADFAWNTEAYQDGLAHGGRGAPGNGEWYYVGMGAAAGLAVGALKCAWSAFVCEIPADLPGLFVEVKDLYCHHPLQAPCVVLCSAVSLACGCSVGPEAAMGSAGAALGMGVSRLVAWWRGRALAFGARAGGAGADVAPSAETEMDVLTGMAGAMGAIFPSPLGGVLLLHELGLAAEATGDRRKLPSFMEVVAQTGLAAASSYAVFVGLKQLTFLKAFKLPVSANDLVAFEVADMGTAVWLGVVGGVTGLVGVVCMGLLRKAGDAVRARLDALGARCGLDRGPRGGVRLGLLLTPVVGGVLYGLLAVAFPLTLGDGNAQLKVVIAQGRHLGAGALVATGVGKMLCLGVCLGFGFVGGQIFPLIFAGACVGMALVVASIPAAPAAAAAALAAGLPLPHLPPAPALPLVLVVPCLIVAVPCAFAPAVFTMVVITCLLLELGGGMAAPVFVAGVVSFTTVCGLGLIQRLITRGKALDDDEDEEAEDGGGAHH